MKGRAYTVVAGTAGRYDATGGATMATVLERDLDDAAYARRKAHAAGHNRCLEAEPVNPEGRFC
jgi:hypothetical protein